MARKTWLGEIDYFGLPLTLKRLFYDGDTSTLSRNRERESVLCSIIRTGGVRAFLGLWLVKRFE